MAGNRLLLIDGMSIIRRVYEAVGGEDTPERAEKAVISCVGSFHRALNSYDPTHVLCVLDASGTNWRHDIYPQYKDNRDGCPDVLVERLPDLAEYLFDMQVWTVAKPGFEADDIIGHITEKVAPHIDEVVILSQDKDMYQLITDNVIVRKHFAKTENGEVRDWNAAEVVNKYGIEPSQFRDYLALVGDKADNVPGLNGVGGTFATKLLIENGSIDKILKRLSLFEELIERGEPVDEVAKMPEVKKFFIRPSIFKALLARKDEMLMSKELVGFRPTPLSISLADLRFSKVQNVKAKPAAPRF